MYSPPLQLQPISTVHYFVSGDVLIQAGAAIAPGVLLQADPDSRIVIAVGVCLGIGCVIHAHNGTIEVGEGAIIGAGVLLIGNVTIGARACVGSATTVFDSTIAPGAMIPAGSLLGDRSRLPEEDDGAEPRSIADDASPQSSDSVAPLPAETSFPADSKSSASADPPVDLPADSGASAQSVESNGANVYGQMYVNQLLVKLFPHKQDLDKNEK